MSGKQCEDCCKLLTDEEAFYYAHRCEGCERRKFERHEKWRLGMVDDPELDAFYSAPARHAL